MKSKLLILSITLAFVMQTVTSASPQSRPRIELTGTAATVTIDLAGGSMADFHLNSNPVNPLNWNHPEPGKTGPHAMGHFICFDRWGPCSENEEKNGMRKHGEAVTVPWTVLLSPKESDGRIVSEIQCELPVAGMTMKRTLELSKEHAVLKVAEAATNINTLGRLYNVVQHATIGAPFLDESMMIDTNATKGFVQDEAVDTIEADPFTWPDFSCDGKQYDLRKMRFDGGSNVTSFIFDEGDEYGWITTANPGKGVLLGYIWKIADYPWLNLWRDARPVVPPAFAIEFGSTGLHQPFKALVEKREIFGRQLFEYIDAGETAVKSYTVFLVEIPDDFQGVESVQVTDNQITLMERGSSDPRNIIIGQL